MNEGIEFAIDLVNQILDNTPYDEDTALLIRTLEGLVDTLTESLDTA
jgi:hypothetical protein